MIHMFCIHSQINQYKNESEKFKKECVRLHSELDKKKKDAQGKLIVYKENTKQFQVQEKSGEAKVHVSV